MKNLTLTFWSGVNTVTGSNFEISDGRHRMLIDCGLTQGTPDTEKINSKPFPYNLADINVLFITHAHIDHIGRVPKLVKDGFHGEIFSTPETEAIAEFMFEDLLRVQERKRQENETDPSTPTLFDEVDVKKALSLWKTFPYHQKFEAITNGTAPLNLADRASGEFSFEFLDAGHILGSAMIKITYKSEDKKNGGGKEIKILFTGDTGNSPSPLIRDTEIIEGINYLIVDSVYGDRNHEPKDVRDKRFAEIVRASIARRGTLVIPVFSLERAQIILYELDKLVETGAIPTVPVFLDSPLAIKLTSIYRRSSALFNKAAHAEVAGGDDIFNFPRLKLSVTARDSMAIEGVADPKIILAGSGMSSGGRVTIHEAKYLPQANNTLLLTGYQAVGTLGRLIEEGAKEVEINGEKIPVRARIEKISGYSGHKDSERLLEFVETAGDSLKKVFVVMGEPKSALFLVQRIRDYLGVDAVHPVEGKVYKI